MPRLRLLPLLCCLALAAAGCRVKDIRTFVVEAPDIHSAADAQAVLESLNLIAVLDRPRDQAAPPPPNVVVDEKAHTSTAAWPHPSAVHTSAISLAIVHWDAGTVEITYDSMKLAIKNLQFAVADAGFLVKAEPYDIQPHPSAPAGGKPPAARP